MLIGQDHTPTGVIDGVQTACHRISRDVDLSKPDNDLRHEIYSQGVRSNTFPIYPSGGLSLKQFLDQCRDKGVIPMIKLNFGRRIWDIQKRADLWKAKYTLGQWQRLSRLTAEIICNLYSFEEKYLPVFNEPYKWLDRHEVGMYTRATNQGIGPMRTELPIVAGNDEYDLAAAKGNGYHYLLVHFSQDFDYIGDQPLSSIMNDAYWKIKAQADLAKQYSKPIMATEAGSWEHRYTSGTGHERNKRIILECKKNGYEACNIVLIDSNDSYFPRLGYRGWDKYYTRIVSLPQIRAGLTYFEDFINFVKEHGEREKQEDRDMRLEKYYYKDKVTFTRDPNKAGVRFIQDCLNLKTDSIFGPLTEEAVKNYQEVSGLAVDGIVGPVTFRALKYEYPIEFTNLIYNVAIGEW